MALATPSTPGEIHLNGDFIDGDAYNPELKPSGVIPNTYVLGQYKINSKGLVVDADNVDSSLVTGSINLDLATTTSPGIVQIDDTGFDVSGGILSINFTETADNLRDATAGVKGVVSVGSNVNVVSGDISVAVAHSTTTKGVVKSANANHIVITNGDIDVVSATVNDQHEWGGTQFTTPTTLSGTSITPNGNVSNYFKITVNNVKTLNAITNYAVGEAYTFEITTDNDPTHTLTFNSFYKIKSIPQNVFHYYSKAIMTCIIVASGKAYCVIEEDWTATA